MRDAAAQVGLGVSVIDLDGGGAVGEALAVLLQLEVAHPPVGVHHVIVLLQPERVRVVREGRAVLARLVRLVAFLFLRQRAALDLRGCGMGRAGMGRHQACAGRHATAASCTRVPWPRQGVAGGVGATAARRGAQARLQCVWGGRGRAADYLDSRHARESLGGQIWR